MLLLCLFLAILQIKYPYIMQNSEIQDVKPKNVENEEI